VADILPPPKPKRDTEPQADATKANELTELAAFILANATAEFDRHLGVLLSEIGQAHDVYAGNCETPHWHEEVPCDEFERGVSLGIAWLKARIKDGGAGRAS